MPDAQGVVASALRTTQQGQVYLNIKVVATDIPPTNARTPQDVNGAFNAAYDAATNSIKVTGV